MKNVKLLKLNCISDDRGSLTPIEACKDIPFEIKRVYYITDVPENSIRGGHAHKSLEQVIICLNGSVTIKLDNGQEKETFILDKNNTALYLNSHVWCDMYNFKSGTVLLVLVPEYYDKSDYISNYNEFFEISSKE